MTADNNPSVKPQDASQSGGDLSPNTGNGTSTPYYEEGGITIYHADDPARQIILAANAVCLASFGRERDMAVGRLYSVMANNAGFVRDQLEAEGSDDPVTQRIPGSTHPLDPSQVGGPKVASRHHD